MRWKRRFLGFPLFTAALLAVAACVTINVYFPEKAIEDLSQQIEDEVQKRAAQIEEGEAPPAVVGVVDPVLGQLHATSVVEHLVRCQHVADTGERRLGRERHGDRPVEPIGEGR